MWSRWNFCLVCLNACGALIKCSGLTIELWHTSDVFVSIAEAFIVWVSKPLVPQQLLRLQPNCMDRNGFVDNQLEASDIDSFQLIRHCLKCIIELLMFHGFDDSNFSIDCMFADIDK